MSRDTFGTSTSARYWRHPASGAGTLLADGMPFDAGTAEMVTNNVNVLRQESLRHLFSCPLIGGIAKVGSDGWENLAEDIPDAAHRATTAFAIAWGRSTAVKFGPFPVLYDVIDSTIPGADYNARRARVKVRCKSAAADSLTVYFATTSTPFPPTYGYVSLTTSTTTSTTPVTLTSSPILEATPFGGAPGTDYLAGAGADAGSGVVRVPEFYVWVGFAVANSAATLYSASGWEVES